MLELHVENNENVFMCKECGGMCCKRFAGIYHPEQVVHLDIDIILQKLLQHEWAIDSYVGDPRDDHDSLDDVYFIRPSHKNVSFVNDDSWGGECSYLTADGCKLSFEDRPIQCQVLEPKESEDGKCSGDERYDKRNLSIIWIHHQFLISRLKNNISAVDRW